MNVFCPACEQWSAIPADLSVGEANGHAHSPLPAVLCEHCGALLSVEARYTLCPDCGRIHLAGYLVCPHAVEGLINNMAAAGTATPTVHAQKRRPRKKRSDDYYLQLYFEYRETTVSSVEIAPATEPASEAPPAIAATGPLDEPDDLMPPLEVDDLLPPAPSSAYGSRSYAHANDNGNGNGNGNGHTYANGRGNGNGYANGNGNGNGAYGRKPAGSKVDLALTEAVPVTLFPEIEEEERNAAREADAAREATAHVSGGNYNEFEYELISDPSRLAEVAEMLSREQVLGLDTETTGLDPHTVELLLLQISTLDKVYIVDCRRVVPLALKGILESHHVKKIAQNAKFEYEMLKQRCGIVVDGMFDTMLAERLLMAGIGREISLKQIAQKYLGAVLDKSVREAFYKLAHNGDAYLASEQLHYAARDAFIMIPIFQIQERELRKQRLTQVAELEFRCIAAVGDMELAGVQIDVERWRKIIADVAVQRDKASEELCELLAPVANQATMFGVSAINLNSSTQLMEAFSKLGVDLPDTMEATLVKFNHPAVAKLLEYRAHEKTLSAFGENVLSLINPVTGRIHPDFNQYGADTGRFSCTRPNVQQIPATSDFRKCFVAAPGNKLVTCLIEGTRISTTRGLIPIEEVQPEDHVWQEDGSTRPVLRTINQGTRPTVNLRTQLGYELTVTPEHRIRVLDAHGNYVWREAANLQPEDYIALSMGAVEHPAATALPLKPLEHDHFNAVNRAMPTEVTPELALLMGYMTGDGTFRHDYAGFVVCHKDGDVTEQLSALCGRLFDYEPKRYAYRGVVEQRIFSMQIREWLQQNGAAKDRVPEFLWTSGAEVIAAYLRGLFEADGSVQDENTGRVSFSTIHEQLAREVQELLVALGIAAKRYKQEHGKGCGFIWFLTVPAAWKAKFRDRVGFISARKKSVLDRLMSIVGKGNGYGTIPNMAEHAAHALQTCRTTTRSGALLRNVTRRKGALSIQTATMFKERYPAAYSALDIDHLVTTDFLFDKVVSVEDAGAQTVYDLTVEETSTYIARGFVNHNCDYSQAELRILAELSGDPAFVDAFKSGQDLHTLTASQMFGVPVDAVQKPQRSAAKAINFGLAYGMGPGGLAPRLGVTLDEAKELIARYFKAYPGIQRWLDKAAKDAVRLGYSITPIGRKRFYTMPDESLKRHNEDEWRRQISAIERQGKNSPIQGSNADMTKLALINLRVALQGWDARTVNTVHDEIVVEAREDQAEEVKQIVEHAMISAGQALLKEVPIVADAAVADYWSK